MRRSSQGDFPHRQKPVEKIELSEKHIPLRIILVVVCIAIAGVALAAAINGLMDTHPGWQQVEVDSDTVNCSQDFVLNYDFSQAGSSATSLYRQVSKIYSQSCEKAYLLFTPDNPAEDFGNVYAVNQAVNTPVSVDPWLYRAFEVLEENDCRLQYLAPVYALYDDLISSDSDVMAAQLDPAQDSDMAAYAAQIAEFARDEGSIHLELLGDDQVRLTVSRTYLQFAEENGISVFLDFHWMTNAFIVDYLAEQLQENGFTDGYLASHDGFTRNLDTRGTAYSGNIFNRDGLETYQAGQMIYARSCAMVYLRDYPANQRDQWSYYTWEDGTITGPYVDLQDGCAKAATDGLLSYAYDGTCAQVLMNMLDVYIREELDESCLKTLEKQGIHSVWCENRTVFYTERGLTVTDLYDRDGVTYTAACAEK